MTPVRIAGAMAAALVVAGLPGAAQDRPGRFRAGTSVVMVDALVRNGRSIVTGLPAGAFQVLDDGVLQTIDGLTTEQLPIDLTIVLDASGSTSPVIDAFAANARAVAAILRPDDRVRLVTFATDVVESGGFRSGAERLPLDGPRPSGGTSLHDAMLLTLAQGPVQGRRHLVVVFTDGIDTTSVIRAEAVAAAAARSESAVHLVLSGPGAAARPDPAVRVLQEAAEATGGDWHRLDGRDAVRALGEVFLQFRQSYVLHYRPTDPHRGWHDLTVRLTLPGAHRYTVRARRGYFAR